MVSIYYHKDAVYAYPNGWTCISCGTEFSERTIDVECFYVINTDEGTKCFKCCEKKGVINE